MASNCCSDINGVPCNEVVDISYLQDLVSCMTNSDGSNIVIPSSISSKGSEYKPTKGEIVDAIGTAYINSSNWSDNVDGVIISSSVGNNSLVRRSEITGYCTQFYSLSISNSSTSISECGGSSTSSYSFKLKQSIITCASNGVVTISTSTGDSYTSSNAVASWTTSGNGSSTNGPIFSFSKNYNTSSRTATQSLSIKWRGNTYSASNSITFTQSARQFGGYYAYGPWETGATSVDVTVHEEGGTAWDFTCDSVAVVAEQTLKWETWRYAYAEDSCGEAWSAYDDQFHDLGYGGSSTTIIGREVIDGCNHVGETYEWRVSSPTYYNSHNGQSYSDSDYARFRCNDAEGCFGTCPDIIGDYQADEGSIDCHGNGTITGHYTIYKYDRQTDGSCKENVRGSLTKYGVVEYINNGSENNTSDDREVWATTQHFSMYLTQPPCCDVPICQNGDNPMVDADDTEWYHLFDVRNNSDCYSISFDYYWYPSDDPDSHFTSDYFELEERDIRLGTALYIRAKQENIDNYDIIAHVTAYYSKDGMRSIVLCSYDFTHLRTGRIIEGCRCSNWHKPSETSLTWGANSTTEKYITTEYDDCGTFEVQVSNGFSISSSITDTELTIWVWPISTNSSTNAKTGTLEIYYYPNGSTVCGPHVIDLTQESGVDPVCQTVTCGDINLRQERYTTSSSPCDMAGGNSLVYSYNVDECVKVTAVTSSVVNGTSVTATTYNDGDIYVTFPRLSACGHASDLYEYELTLYYDTPNASNCTEVASVYQKANNTPCITCNCNSVSYPNETSYTWLYNSTASTTFTVTYTCGSLVTFMATPNTIFNSSTASTTSNGVTTATLTVWPISTNDSYTTSKTGSAVILFKPDGATSPCETKTISLVQSSKNCSNSDLKYSFTDPVWCCEQTTWEKVGTISATCCSIISAHTYSTGWCETSSVTQSNGSIDVYAKTKSKYADEASAKADRPAHIYIRYKCGDNTQTELSANTITLKHCDCACNCDSVTWPSTGPLTWCNNDIIEKSITVVARCGTISASASGDFSASTTTTTSGFMVKVKPSNINTGSSNKTGTLTLSFTPEGGGTCTNKTIDLTQYKQWTITANKTLTCSGGEVEFTAS